MGEGEVKFCWYSMTLVTQLGNVGFTYTNQLAKEILFFSSFAELFFLKLN